MVNPITDKAVSDVSNSRSPINARVEKVLDLIIGIRAIVDAHVTCFTPQTNRCVAGWLFI